VKSHLRRFEMVPLTSTTYLIVIISDTGRVEQRTVAIAMPPRRDDIDRLITAVNARGDGQSIALLSRLLRDLGESDDFSSLRGVIENVASAVSGMRDEERSDSLYMSGASQLTRQGAASLTTLAPLLDALEEQVVLMRLMGAVSRSADSSGVGGVGVAIGSETHTRGLLNASVVTSGYGTDDSAGASFGARGAFGTDDAGETAGNGADRNETGTDDDEPDSSDAAAPLAFVGSIGPTHMNYPTTIAAVKAVAEYLSAFINRQDL
jgi:heat-inducible transcriptional repressor